MSLSNEQRPLFCLYALANEDTGNANNMLNVTAYLANALRDPYQAKQFEEAAECVLRNNGFDPNHDRGWKDAGIENGRDGAVQIMKKSYLAAVPVILQHLATNVKDNPYDYKPSALAAHNPITHAIGSLQRAQQDKNADYLLTDEAWQEAGISSMADFQEAVRKIFVDARVGGHVAYDLKLKDESQVDGLSVKAADYAIQKAFPELAAKLVIPVNISQGLLPQSTATASAFGKAKDWQPY